MFKLRLRPQINTNRLYLERFSPLDAEDVFRVYGNSPEATKFVSWPMHQSIDDSRSFLAYATSAWEEGTDCSYAIRMKQSGQLIGSIGAINEDAKVQFGYVLGPSFWGFGYATEAVKTLLDQLKTQEGIVRIGAFTDVGNLASAKVLLKAGLMKEGTLKNWMKFPNQGGVYRDCHVFRLP